MNRAASGGPERKWNMKTLVLILASVCGVIAGSAFYLAQHRSPSTPVSATQPETSDIPPANEPAVLPAAQPEVNPPSVSQTNAGSIIPPKEASAAVAAPAVTPQPSLLDQQALGTLVSSQASFDQKQAAWKQIRDSGHLDQAIAELEQMARSSPTVAEYPAVLGQACLQKAGTLSDIREQGILGLKADQSFDASLNLDPSNWEAGFWKAAAMSHWPPQLGKGKEVIERFVSLINLQEMQSPQPQFAQTYVLLGEQYQKQGYPDYARETWQRGATLFPNDAVFAQKLNPPAADQAQVRN